MSTCKARSIARVVAAAPTPLHSGVSDRMVTAATAKPSKQPTTEQILGVLEGTAKAKRLSITYLIGALVVSLVMILLPVVYAGLIAAVGYGLYYHVTNHMYLWNATGSHRWGFVVYLLPIPVGLVFIGFMLKPFLRRARHHATGLVIDAHNEPVLPAFIEKLCRSMGTPVPREIKVDCDVNASAGLTHGIFGTSLTLTIGLPLVANLTLKELTGVLAHEFGHFAQPIGMRLTYIIRTINDWFARVVYERDHWDDKLAEGSESEGYLAVVFLVTRLLIWLTRRILWVLMFFGQAISCFLSRQMEYDADRNQAAVSGTDAFENTMKKLRRLGVATHIAYGQLAGAWRDRRLADDLPALIAHQYGRLPKDLTKIIDKSADKQRTGIFHTHPADNKRVKRVKKLDAPGIVRRDGPARLLLKNFDAIAKAATLIHYREMISRSISSENLVQTKRLLQEEVQADREGKAGDGYFGHHVYLCRPVFFDDAFIAEAEDLPATLRMLKKSHKRISSALPKVIEAYKKYAEADERLLDVASASALDLVRVRYDAKEFHLDRTGREGIDEARSRWEGRKESAGGLLLTYEQVLRKRMMCALQLLRSPDVVKRLEAAPAMLKEAKRVIAVSARLRDIFSSYADLRIKHTTFVVLLNALEYDPENERIRSMVGSRLSDMLEIVRTSRDELRDVPYPFDHADGRIGVGQYLVGYLPGAGDPQGALDAVSSFIDKLDALYVRTHGRLAFIARHVEKLAGLSAFEMPPDEETDDSNTGDSNKE